MLTKIVFVPPGECSIESKIDTEVRKEFSAKDWEIKSWKAVKKPHLPCKTGEPYWVTLWEIDKCKERKGFSSP